MSVSIEELAAVAGQIRHTPQILHLMLMGTSPDDLRWNPQPSRFSIAKVLAHMAHVDEHCFGPRLRASLEDKEPTFADYDDRSFLDTTIDFLSNGPARLDSFTAGRTRWAKLVETVTVRQTGLKGIHATLGPITVAELLHEWAFHDLGHVRQVAELLRARCYYPRIGPFQPMYTVRP